MGHRLTSKGVSPCRRPRRCLCVLDGQVYVSIFSAIILLVCMVMLSDCFMLLEVAIQTKSLKPSKIVTSFKYQLCMSLIDFFAPQLILYCKITIYQYAQIVSFGITRGRRI